MCFSKLEKILFYAYRINIRFVRNIIIFILLKTKAGEIRSVTLSNIFRTYHSIDVGMYSHGACFKKEAIDKYTTIGRYCSIATTARVINKVHDETNFSNYDFFNTKKNQDMYKPLIISSDVWIGHNAIILSSVYKIEVGAVIAAGAVVTKNVPAYAIVVGNPARIVRYRFDQNTIAALIKSKWWERPVQALNIEKMNEPLDIIDNNKKFKEELIDADEEKN